MLYKITSSLHFRLLKRISLSGVKKTDSEGNKLVYLTFDDGPDCGITEFVLDQLSHYGFKGTFFCLGRCCENNNDLYERLINEGHTIGSHTYSHVNGHTMRSTDYEKEITRGAKITKSILFRPPWGAIRFSTYFKLVRKGYKVYLWNTSSSDADYDGFDLGYAYRDVTKHTHPGSVVLFHFSNELEPYTRQILPPYLKWLSENDYKCIGL